MIKLKPYQVTGICQIQHFKGRVLLADEMGLGKTIQALWWIKKRPLQRPVIIVCPANTKLNVWEEQTKHYLGIRCIVLNGQKPPNGELFSHDQFYIINYEVLQYWLEWLVKLQPKVLIFDESHYIKNRKAKRTKALKALAKVVPYVIAISGTPLTNRPAELWTTLNTIRPDLYQAFFPFAMRYCNPRRTHWGWNFNGAAHLDELHNNLKTTMMIRRLKKDVLKELPGKTRQVIPLVIEDEKEYFEAVDNFLTRLAKQSVSRLSRAVKAEQLVKMGYLKRLAAKLKMKSVIEWVDSFLEESDDKLVLYGIHRAVLGELYSHYKSISVLTDGSTQAEARRGNIQAFQKNNAIRLFIGNIQAAGVGITLTAASSLGFVELDWTPGNHIQAEDRIHRIGQKNARNIYYLIAKGTIEEDLCSLIQQKQTVISTTLDGSRKVNQLNIFDQLTKIIKMKGVSYGKS